MVEIRVRPADSRYLASVRVSNGQRVGPGEDGFLTFYGSRGGGFLGAFRRGGSVEPLFVGRRILRLWPDSSASSL